MVGGDAQVGIADAVDNRSEGIFDALRVNVSEIERRQHHRLGHTERKHALGDLDRIGDRGSAGAERDPIRSDAGLEEGFGGGEAFGAAERWAFAAGNTWRDGATPSTY